MLDKDLNSSTVLKHVRTITKVASLFVVLYLALALLIDFVYIYAFSTIGITDSVSSSFWTCKLCEAIAATAIAVLLLCFLRSFASDASLLDNKQVFRLISCSLLLIVQWLISILAVYPSEDIPVMSTPIAVDLAANTEPTFTKPLFAVLLLCVAAILRYAAALKEDSDLIL